jgi:uncharacterized damage-inducible protein DinB
MREIERIAGQLRSAWEGESWHGPPVRTILSGIAAEKARARPLAGTHSIWELTLHIATWESIVARRLRGERIVEVVVSEDWPPVLDASDQGWEHALEQLEASHRMLETEISSFPNTSLGATVFGKDYNYYVMLHGIVQHDLYHAGQIALLKKALG